MPLLSTVCLSCDWVSWGFVAKNVGRVRVLPGRVLGAGCWCALFRPGLVLCGFGLCFCEWEFWECRMWFFVIFSLGSKTRPWVVLAA